MEITDEEDGPDFSGQPPESAGMFQFKYRTLKTFNFYKPKIQTDFVRAASFFCPDKDVMRYMKEHHTAEDKAAMESILLKSKMPTDIISSKERAEQEAAICSEFWTQQGEFWDKEGVFAKERIWITAEKPGCLSYDWHRQNSLKEAPMFGPIAVRVCAKSTGISDCERHWKQNKRMSQGQRNRLSPHKAQMQAALAADYSRKKAKARRERAAMKKQIYEDQDFLTEGLKHPWTEEEVVHVDQRVFRAWNEKWEKQRFDCNGCKLFEAQFSKKYGGLMFADPDRQGELGWTMTDGCAVLQRLYRDRKKRTFLEPEVGYNWYYALLVCYDGFDVEKAHDVQSDKFYDLFELPASTDVYELIADAYRNNKRFKVYQKEDVEEYNPKLRKHPFEGLPY